MQIEIEEATITLNREEYLALLYICHIFKNTNLDPIINSTDRETKLNATMLVNEILREERE